MKCMKIPEHFKDLFRYDDGELYWKVERPRKKSKVGQKVKTSSDSYGYRFVHIDGKNYRMHRIVWFLVKGEQPPDILDHINNIKYDNRIENLREATKSQNNWNAPLCRRNTSGFKNVYRCKNTGKWRVQVKANNVKREYGRYADLEEAKQVAIKAREELHKEFANHG